MLESLSLIHLRVGQKARVLRLLPVDEGQLRKLIVFGILPGVVVEILQRYPLYVLKVGYTQIALDDDIVKNIIVTK
ncbi:ferrous iron transport protein A [Pelosinus sp. sgz500959]|uniref:ferrous iron transport protein A n=1 Tax=Pelosinus sp. sgz500959 TaxID=3242472 RepID=UPI0036731BE2